MPNATPSLQPYYRIFITTTSCSAPVSCFSTLILIVLAIWISSLTSRRLVPAVPYRSPDKNHAIYTPDTAHPITRHPMSLSQVMETPLILMSFSGLRRVNNGSGLFVFLINTCQILHLHSTSTLTTITLNESRLKWFEAPFWKTASKDLPSSSIKLIHKVLVHFELLCVPAAHFRFSILLYLL